MKILLQISSLFITFILSSSIANASADKTPEQLEHDKWLKLRFSAQHERLIPVVAVADMFFACDQAKNSGNANYQVKELVEDMDRNLLAEKLTACLAGATTKSDIALNYGLHGCFSEQLSSLPAQQKLDQMAVVTASISTLSREERQKSFTRCVTDQSISYLK
ncbi:hypothetical protein [Colwellia sp. MB3u-55]|jgi:hypothetical protein|uniref:hypothetical protein n=1 Tax=Colwellia sp. MB3u-55 TaxID=2759810 RepID=UPI0015F604EF|nr:hypothetical protein [Colwellia sp. MB3u-55]MBA6251573.1 hypothetical protein [Colwellia sp. MB3u-55]